MVRRDDATELLALLSALPSGEPLGARVETASRLLLGRPWVADPLGGGPESREVLTADLGSFDCLTYVETVLALAASATGRQFLRRLQTLRYREGRVAWRTRNHYASGWIRENARAGLVRAIALDGPSVVRQRRLDVVAGIPARRVALRVWPKRVFWRARDGVRTGDLLLFASTRRDLDVFHVGIAVRVGNTLRLRHAARSKGAAVEQDLAEFLRANTMAGLIVARPCAGRR